MDKSEKAHEEFKNAYYKVKIKPEDVNYEIANSYIPFFNYLDSLGTGAVVVLDYFKDNFFFISKNFSKVFGFHQETLFTNKQVQLRKRIHPDDYIINVAAIKTRAFLLEEPIDKRKDYKFTQELRMLNDRDEWVRMIVQSNNIELDAKGNLWLNICICDLSPIQDPDAIGKAVLWDTRTGDVVFTMEGHKQTDVPITNREREVLKLISTGMRSKEIADKLFISINTVNNHRKKLLEKMKVSNSSEAVKLAAKLGVI